MTTSISVDLDSEYGDDEAMVSFSTDLFTLQVTAPLEDFLALEEVRSAVWDDRSSLVLGTCLGVLVSWSYSDEDETVTLLVGHDDETWDVALNVPAALVDSLVEEVRQTLDEG